MTCCDSRASPLFASLQFASLQFASLQFASLQFASLQFASLQFVGASRGNKGRARLRGVFTCVFELASVGRRKETREAGFEARERQKKKAPDGAPSRTNLV